MPFEIKQDVIMVVHATGKYGIIDGVYADGNHIALTLEDGSTALFTSDQLRFPNVDLWVVTEANDTSLFYDAVHESAITAVDDALARKGNRRYEIRHFVNGEWVGITYLVLEGKVFQVVPFEWIPKEGA